MLVRDVPSSSALDLSLRQWAERASAARKIIALAFPCHCTARTPCVYLPFATVVLSLINTCNGKTPPTQYPSPYACALRLVSDVVCLSSHANEIMCSLDGKKN